VPQLCIGVTNGTGAYRGLVTFGRGYEDIMKNMLVVWIEHPYTLSIVIYS